MKGVCYSSYFNCYSGMGEAAREIIVALHKANVPLLTQLVPNLTINEDLGESYNVAKELMGANVDYEVKIIHITPDLITKNMTPMKYHIFHLFWETDSLPKWWVWALNLCDEIWTGDEYHAEQFKKSGIKKPIWVCPQPINTDIEEHEPIKLVGKETFMFYSIFQWIERKNPEALIKAYVTEFAGENKVGLLIKTYKERFTQEENKEIVDQINKWIEEIKVTNFPAIYLMFESLSKNDVMRVHATGDCFVLPHRGEGWGRPIQEAMLLKKPVITTSFGGINEYIPRDCGFLLKYRKTPVFNMGFAPWYEETQLWADVDIKELREQMRFVYNHQAEAREVGLKESQLIKDTFNYDIVGQKMKNRLIEINKLL